MVGPRVSGRVSGRVSAQLAPSSARIPWGLSGFSHTGSQMKLPAPQQPGSLRFQSKQVRKACPWSLGPGGGGAHGGWAGLVSLLFSGCLHLALSPPWLRPAAPWERRV